MIINKNNNIYIVHIFNKLLRKIDIFDIDGIVSFFKIILSEVKKKYMLCGLCDIEVYYDDNYGMIMEIDNYYQEGSYLDINVKFFLDSCFMMEINDDIESEYDHIYYYNGKYYSYYKKDCDSEIIYKDYLKIIDEGFKVK